VALLLAATAAVAAATKRVGAQEAACEVDYAVAIDESGSIEAREFDTARMFVRSIITAAASRSAAARFSIVAFSSSTTVIATGVYAAAAAAAMEAHAKSSGGTRIDRTLTAAAATLMAGSGSGAARGRALILVTDGASPAASARAAAAVVKQNGIAIVTVAVGGHTDEALLAELASDPTLVFKGKVDALVGVVGGLVADTVNWPTGVLPLCGVSTRCGGGAAATVAAVAFDPASRGRIWLRVIPSNLILRTIESATSHVTALFNQMRAPHVANSAMLRCGSGRNRVEPPHFHLVTQCYGLEHWLIRAVSGGDNVASRASNIITTTCATLSPSRGTSASGPTRRATPLSTGGHAAPPRAA